VADPTDHQLAPTNGVTCRRVPRYFASREVPTMGNSPDDRESYVQRKGFADAKRAWLWVARAALFWARAQHCYCKRLEQEYRGEPAMDGGPDQCRYCDKEKWRPVVERLARIMRHRSEKAKTRP
jgi:hypothetical protein